MQAHELGRDVAERVEGLKALLSNVPSSQKGLDFVHEILADLPLVLFVVHKRIDHLGYRPNTLLKSFVRPSDMLFLKIGKQLSINFRAPS
jgi:hypothetical protein